MENNKIIDELIDKIPQAKEAIEKVEGATGKKIGDIAGEIGDKINDVIKENNNGEEIKSIGDIANKLFKKND